jgi:pimeloyl-ACP methyl ester carboxylesterase
MALVWHSYESGTVRIGDFDLAYKTVGQGPPILLVHGWMGKGYSWRKLAPLLAPHAQVIMPDMRGYGDSGKPSHGYDACTLKTDLQTLIAVLGVGKPVVVGHDMGAMPSFMYAAENPDDIAALCYLDEPLPGYNLDQYTIFAEPLGGFWWFGMNWTPELCELLIEGKEREYMEMLMTSMIADKSALTSEDFDEYLRTYKGREGIAGSVGWYRAALISTEQMRNAGRLPASLPLLALGGEYGISGTFEQMKLVHDKPAGGVIAACGHLIAEEKPEELANALLGFMKSNGLL